MPVPRYDVPAGAIDGVNRVFTTLAAYSVGTVQVFRTGQLLVASTSLVETDSALGLVTLVTAPIAGDTIHLFYLDTSPGVPATAIQAITGVIEELTIEGILGAIQ